MTLPSWPTWPAAGLGRLGLAGTAGLARARAERLRSPARPRIGNPGAYPPAPARKGAVEDYTAVSDSRTCRECPVTGHDTDAW